MKRLNEYLSEHDKDFLLACQIHYYTLIRPNELTFVQINDISVRDQTLFISKEVSKNRKDAKVTIPTKVIKMMIDRGIFSYRATTIYSVQDSGLTKNVPIAVSSAKSG